MIALTREDAALLVAASQAMLPTLVAAEHPAAWSLGQALTAAETALIEDTREDEARPSEAKP